MSNELKAQLTLVKGLQFVGAGGSHHSVVLDSDFEGNIPAGNKPMELLLIALGGCTGMDVISILRKKRQVVRYFALEVKGYRREEHPRIFEKIEIKYILKGDNLSEEAIQRAIELSQEKYCSVSAMLKPVAKIETSYEILK
ncbi:OsmC family protein [Candidatus Aminicenantes bacterium AC-335-A11]|jgi:putative redox protein|nr:OsmC family protein [SCandidatus Aminicenantes bacterium Aminicenantia_JdfR_composite]MCP2597786.1 OsmC family protein [Candidatus Aminicenantes bacterium AC-335-L06]MCP2618467.1 OsmC family protein [Candidatus Aminicenantes bacterium AC-335-A11]MCP2620511.1 OsmC family protein [Candidatus Aminicenantes bacterium AC-334-E05]